MIKAIFFDLGGVLLPMDMERSLEAFRTRAGFKDIRDYLDFCHQKGFFSDIELGNMDTEEFFCDCLHHCAPGTTKELLIECFNEFFLTPPAENIEYVKELSQKYEVDLLSNNNAVAMSLHQKNFATHGLPLDTSFKHLFLSYEMHLLKPDPEIFRCAASMAGFKPKEILFIDDSQQNLDGASKAGLNTVCYKIGEGDLKTIVEAELARLNG